MAEEVDRREVEAEIEGRNLVRAVLLAEQAGLPEQEVRDLRARAICQMAAHYRNSHGTRRLAHRFGFSREEVKEILETFALEAERNGNKALAPCYDYSTGKHITFSEWKVNLLKAWNRLPA